MSSKLQVRQLCIGEGMPKVCVPLLAQTQGKLLVQAAEVLTMKPDLIEWRADLFNESKDYIPTLEALRGILGNVPLLFTLRTKREHGYFAEDASLYEQVITQVVNSGLADIIDVELFTPAQTLQAILDSIHKKSIQILLSNHDFISTPSKREILRRLRQMEALGAHIAKIAVKPHSAEDVLTLLNATQEGARTASIPLITIAMGPLGVVTRISGEVFGSCVTFGRGVEESAPGQVPTEELRNILELLHQGCASEQ